MKNVNLFYCLIVLILCACNPHLKEYKCINLSSESYDLSLSNSFRGLSVVDSSIFWVSGTNGTVVHTDNEGKLIINQVPDASEMDFRDVVAFDANTALVMNAGFPAMIYKTVDGGLNWYECYNKQDSAIFLDGMKFWDAQNGIAFGDPIDGHMFILTTKDGGESWQQTASESIPQSLEIEGGFAASGSSIHLQGNSKAWVGMGGTKARVFYTEDKGMHWEVVETPILSGGNMKGIYSLAFKNDLEGIAVGGEYKNENPPNSRAFTKDGGRTWKLGAGVDQYRSGTAYLYDNIYLATGLTGTDITYDGGITWDSISNYKLHGMQFTKDGKVGYGMGIDGVIVKILVSDK